jgi:hypothetical protein
MTDPTPYPDSRNDTAAEREAITGTPRWVKVFGIIALVVVVLFVVVLVIRGGEHGPSRHTSKGGSTMSSGVVAEHARPPSGITRAQQP